LDRWVLSELNLTVERVTREFDAYNPTDAGRAIQDFVDDLSNWYVRRSRRRFWKSGADQDKLAAYDTLYTCLVTVAKLMAPLAPFVAEELWQNLVVAGGEDAAESVHLAFWPELRRDLIDESLSRDVRLVMRVSSLGRAARAKAQMKVRQPLSEMLVQTRTPEEGEALKRLAPALLDELNVKALTVMESQGGLLDYQVRPNLPKLGPKYGKEMGQVSRALTALDSAEVAAAIAAGRPVVAGEYTLEPDEVLVTAKERAGYAVAQEAGYTVALDTRVTPELADEGLARELVHRIQSLRKDAGFEIADRIIVSYAGDSEVTGVMERFSGYVASETLAFEITQRPPSDGAYVERQNVDGREVTLGVQRLEV
jgi:isoleucyl-tRNA synthetase